MLEQRLTCPITPQQRSLLIQEINQHKYKKTLENIKAIEYKPPNQKIRKLFTEFNGTQWKIFARGSQRTQEEFTITHLNEIDTPNNPNPLLQSLGHELIEERQEKRITWKIDEETCIIITFNEKQEKIELIKRSKKISPNDKHLKTIAEKLAIPLHKTIHA